MATLKLYHYWRSSSSWRVRWALAYKGVKYSEEAVNLLDGSSESDAHLKRNPMGFVPVLNVDGENLIESVAIIEWLEENFPTPALFPKDKLQRAHMRALVEIINAGTQPIQNLSVLDKYSQDEAKRKEWMQYFIRQGLSVYEKLIADYAGPWSMGSELTASDLFLVPQIYNALRNEIDMASFPHVWAIYHHALTTPACQASHPDRFKI